VTTADASAPSPSALRLVLAAERLFARHGFDGVSLRQIAAEAGSGNNSAVHYHFGSKHGLIAAIFRHRLPQIIGERRLLAARCNPDDLRSRFEAHFLPVLSMAEATDNHYVSFVEQIQRMDLAVAGDLFDLPAEGLRSNGEFRRDLHRLLRHLDEPLRELRINEGQALCMHAAADRERAVASDAALVPFELFANALFDGIAGFLAAPAPEATMRRLRDAGDVGAGRLRLL
jgi:AcrR family transcriptional regulator